MTQPPKGPGALPLLLRLSMLRSRQRGAGSLAERGYSLAVALIASFVLLLGVGALASRGTRGLIGQAFQVQNRQARDVAESAIAQFANTMNREENRYILISGDTTGASWDASTNSCTAYNSAGVLDGTGIDPVFDVNQFKPSGTFVALGGDGNRRFRVESVEFRRADINRTIFTSSDGAFIDQLRGGLDRSLVRLTVIGQFNQNGRLSTARVAREFEVVPKCCKRSFGQNSIGAVNWGRDSGDCFGGGDPGIRLGPGGVNKGSNNTLDITDQNGQLVSQAACWSGNGTAASDLPPDTSGFTTTETKNYEACVNRTLTQGSKDGSGISFVPTEFGFVFPVYDPDISGNSVGYSPTPEFQQINKTELNESEKFITYFEDPSGNGIRICDDVGGSYANCQRLEDSSLATTPPGPDPCRLDPRTSLNLSASPPTLPVYNCQLRNIDKPNNVDLRFDTTYAEINLMFYDDTFNGEYIGAGGTSEVTRRQCAGSSYTQDVCRVDIDFDTFKQLDSRFRMNIYAIGEGSITLNGGAEGVGFNVNIPFGTLNMLGGGNTNPNFMGQILAKTLNLTGNVTINTFAGSRAPGDDGSLLIDFMARSFTQSSGFGLTNP